MFNNKNNNKQKTKQNPKKKKIKYLAYKKIKKNFAKNAFYKKTVKIYFFVYLL